MQHDPVDVGISELKKRTAKAVLIVVADTGEEIWVPMSVIEPESLAAIGEYFEEVGGEPDEAPDFDTIVVAQWWAKKYGFTED